MRVVFILFLIITTSKLYAQKDSLYTFEFDKLNLIDIFNSIENDSDYFFYYDQSWLSNYHLISKSYQEKTIEFILNDVLQDTEFNFHITEDDNVFLIRNTVIYDELPSGFFQNENIKSERSRAHSVSPVFHEEDLKQSKNKTIKVGKASSDVSKNECIVLGVIKSKQTGNSVPNIKVLVNGVNDGHFIDEAGNLKMTLSKGNYILELISESIENVKRNLIVYNDGQFDIYVNENIEQLKEVVIDEGVKNALTESITKTIIDVEKSKNIPLVLGERDVLKVTTALPGITSTGEGTVGYNVRGGKTDQNLILLDNAVLYNPQHFFGFFSALNPFSVGDITVYKSGIPAKFGGRLSSVMELETKTPSNNEFSGEASVGPVTGNVFIETPIVKERSGLLLGARGAYANWILKRVDNKSLNNSKATFFDVLAKYNHKIDEKNRLETMVYWSKDNFNVTIDSLYGYSNKLISLKLNKKISDKLKGYVAFANSNYGFKIEYDGTSNNDFLFNYGINETNFEINLEHFYKDHLKFEYGVNSKLYNINPGSKEKLNLESDVIETALDKEKGLETALYFSSNIDFTEQLNIDAGLRFSIFNALGSSEQFVYDSNLPKSEETIIDRRYFANNAFYKTYANPEFRLAGRYAINDSFTAKLSYGRTMQYIHTLSNNTTASPVDIWKLSDFNIEPQRLDQFSAGLFKNFKENVYLISLEGFYKKSKNAIDFKTGSEIFLNQNIETEVLQGIGRSYGVEFLAKKNIGNLNGWLSYTFSRSLIKLDSDFQEERVNGGNFFPSNYDRPHDLTLIANYKFTERYSMSTNFAYQTGRPVTLPVSAINFDNSQFVIYSDRNAYRIPDYYRLDIGFNIEGNHKLNKLAHSFWTISVYNVLGRNNPSSVFFVTQNGEIKAYQSSVFSVPVPSITYSFKF